MADSPIAAYPGSDLSVGPLAYKASNTIVTAGAGTITAAQLLGGIYLRDPTGASRTDTTPTATLVLNRLGPGAFAGQSFEFIVQNDADGVERLTIAAGTGATLVGRMVVDPGEQARFMVTLTNVSYASGAYRMTRIGTAKPVKTFMTITGDAAISPTVQTDYRLTKGSAAALTLAAPTAAEEGQEIFITSTTAAAHVLTATGLLQGGAAGHNTATFAAQIGASIVLVAQNLLWVVKSAVGITFG